MTLGLGKVLLPELSDKDGIIEAIEIKYSLCKLAEQLFYIYLLLSFLFNET